MTVGGAAEGPVARGSSGAALVAEATAVGGVTGALAGGRAGEDRVTEAGTVAVALAPGAVEPQGGKKRAGEAAHQSPQHLAAREAAGHLACQLIEIESLAHDRLLLGSLSSHRYHCQSPLPVLGKGVGR
jgi:hypothetical protein